MIFVQYRIRSAFFNILGIIAEGIGVLLTLAEP